MSKWTDEAIATLKRMWAEGASASTIAAQVGSGVSRNAVIGNAVRLGLRPAKKPATVTSPARNAAGRSNPIQSASSAPAGSASENSGDSPRSARTRLNRQQRRKRAKLRTASKESKNPNWSAKPIANPKLTGAEPARIIAQHKRKSKSAARREAAAQREAAAAAAARIDRDRKEAERRSAIKQFMSTIESASFAELLGQWRKHVELVSFIERTGSNRHRLSLYRTLVGSIEQEWQRRSKLVHSTEEYFDWPTTVAKRGKGKIGQVDWIDEGVLGYLGYHVDAHSTLTSVQRHTILRRVFCMHLPPIESPTYMLEWGAPESAARLKKMANAIASFTRQAKRNSSYDMSKAIRRWEHDLQMLHDEFYVGRFGFGWPNS